MLDTSGIAGIMLGSASAGANILSGVSDTSSGKTTDVDKVSKDFESVFISQMMESMFGDSSGDEAFGSTETNDIYKGMMMDQYGKEIVKAGGIGIAAYVKAELIKQQQAQELLKLQEIKQ